MTLRKTILCTITLLLGALVYLNALDNPFVFDDFGNIVENRSLTSPTPHALVFQNVTRPILNLSFFIDRALWGPAPFGFHVTNLALHLLNVALLFQIAWRWGSFRSAAPPTGAAFGAAMLLAVHPMMTMAVGYVSGRSEVLCATWLLLALLSADRWLRGGGTVWLGAVAGLWILALGTKEIAVAFPAVLLLAERWMYPADAAERGRRWRRLHLPLFALAFVGAVLRVTVLGRLEGGAGVALQGDLVLVELDVIRRYLWMMIAPGGQAIFHAVAPVRGIFDARVLLACGVIVSLLAVAWALHRRLPTVGLGLAWFFLLLAPSSLLVALDRAEPMAEHRVYVASAGLFLATGAAFDWMLQRRRGRMTRLVLQVTLASALVLLAARTVVRNMVWDDPVELWLEASRYAPDHWLPYVPLGEALHARGDHAGAVSALTTAVRLRPEEHSTLGKLGVCLVETGQFEQATAMFERLRAVNPATAEVPYGLGLVAAASGDADLARSRFLEVLRLAPFNVPARQALAAVEEPVNPEAALHWCNEIRQIAPDTPGNDECIERTRRRLGRSATHRRRRRYDAA